MDYYQNNYSIYHQRTFYIDPSAFLEPLTSYLAPPARILDVGCGSGRDLLWFKNRGYEVIGLDRSYGLVQLARENTGCRVVQADYNEFDFSRMNVQAILLIGALVHEPREQFSHALENILNALEKNGYVLLSLKQGQGTLEKDDGRKFQLWEREELIPIFDNLQLKILEEGQSSSGIGTGEVWLSYVLQHSGKVRLRNK